MDPWLEVPAGRRRPPPGWAAVLIALVSLGLIIMLTQGGDPGATAPEPAVIPAD